jgi:cell division protein FtsB
VFGHRRTFWVATFVVLAAMLGVLALPVRNMFEQQNRLAATEAEVAALKDRNAELEARTKALHDPGDLELTARRNHGLVFPGEESYSVLPPPRAGQVPGWVSVGLSFEADKATDLPPAPAVPTGSPANPQPDSSAEG